MIGPRIFHTGQVIYGASDYSLHLDIATTQEAKEALTRIKAEGGPASWSYKNYNLPARASRQRLLLQARKMNMACVPEGVSGYLTNVSDPTNTPDWLGYEFRLGPDIHRRWYVNVPTSKRGSDVRHQGMTTVEHNLPVSVLYDDILTLYSLSGTGSTPTHIVNYGGPFGEQLLWASTDIPNDPKYVLLQRCRTNTSEDDTFCRLRRFTRHDVLEGLSESTSRPANCSSSSDVC